MTREEISAKAVETAKYNKNILLEFATGVGKTKTSLDIVNDQGGKWLIVLAERAHVKNWQDDIVKHQYSKLLPNIEFVLYASLHKHASKQYYGIILDEVHNCQTPKRLNALKSVKFDKCVALTATITFNEKKNLESTIGYITTFKFSLTNAINTNILPNPKIYLMGLELDNVNVTQTFIMNKGSKYNVSKITCNYSDRFKVLKDYKNIELTVTCTEYEKYLYLCSRVDYYHTAYLTSYNEGIKNRWLQAATVRKRFLSELKTSHVKKLLNKITSRYICFAGSIAQCNSLGGKNIVHSESSNNQQVIDDFNQKKIDSLYAVGMLREGVNLVDADAIIVQLDSKSRASIQMIGRALRKKNPVIHIFYYKNTQDQTYMNNSLEDFKEFVVNI